MKLRKPVRAFQTLICLSLKLGLKRTPDINLLKMANMCSGFHKVGCLPKESMNSSCNNYCFNFTLLTC